MNRHRHIWRDVSFDVVLSVVLTAVGGLSVAVAQSDGAKLRPAIACLAAGQKAMAIATVNTVQGGDGTADLAQLWLTHAQRSSS